MAEAATKLPVKGETRSADRTPAAWHPFESLRREMHHLFDDFRGDFGRPFFRRPRFEMEPFLGREGAWGTMPAVDLAEKDDAFEITAELPGLSENDVEVKYSNGMLTISGEKQEEKEEKKKDYHLSERRYGAFQRSFSVPEGVDPEKLSATFAKGVLTVTLPKSPEARQKEKRVPIKTA